MQYSSVIVNPVIKMYPFGYVIKMIGLHNRLALFHVYLINRRIKLNFVSLALRNRPTLGDCQLNVFTGILLKFRKKKYLVLLQLS